MTRDRGRTHSEEPVVQSDPSTSPSFVEPAERKHVFASSAVGRSAETHLAWERAIRADPMPLMPAARAQQIDPDEGRRR